MENVELNLQCLGDDGNRNVFLKEVKLSKLYVF